MPADRHEHVAAITSIPPLTERLVIHLLVVQLPRVEAPHQLAVRLHAHVSAHHRAISATRSHCLAIRPCALRNRRTGAERRESRSDDRDPHHPAQHSLPFLPSCHVSLLSESHVRVASARLGGAWLVYKK